MNDIPTFGKFFIWTRFFEIDLEDSSFLSLTLPTASLYTHTRGYMRLGVENTAGKTDYREQVEYAVEDEATRTATTSPSLFYNRLRGTNPWPNDFQPSLRPAIMNLVPQMCRVADGIRQGLCLALGLDQTALDHLFHSPVTAATTHDHRVAEPPHWVLKMVSYPTVQHCDSGTDDPASSSSSPSTPPLGVGSHTDTNFLTLILQQQQPPPGEGGGEGNSGGLQVYSQGQWRNVQLPSSTTANSSNNCDHNSPENYENNPDEWLICNLGESAQIWSQNYFLATPHRVLLASTSASSSSERSSSASRISLPLFYNPRLSAQITPVNLSLLSSPPTWERSELEHKWKRESITPDLKLPSVGDNTFKSLARSHPTVFRKHHPDLTLLDDGRIVINHSYIKKNQGKDDKNNNSLTKRLFPTSLEK